MLSLQTRGTSINGNDNTQVDDSLIVGTRAFLEIADRESRVFLSKTRQALQPNLIGFNGVELSVKIME